MNAKEIAGIVVVGKKDLVTRFDLERAQAKFDRVVAAAAQQQLEHALIVLVKKYVAQTRIKKVCMAGGVALNCLANQKIEMLDEVEELFVQPASSDAGISLGAAYLASAEEGVSVFEKQTHTFFGNEFSKKEIAETLQRCHLNFTVEEKFIEINKKPFEKHRDSKHPDMITIDLGCDSDVVTSNSTTTHSNYHGHMVDVMNQIAESTSHIMTSFATKSAEIDNFITGCKNPNKHRIRLSISPEHHRQILEQNTSKIVDRLAAVNKLVDAGFEVHINLSPIVVTDNFEKEYDDLLNLINNTLTQKAKDQMAYEIIFLTHSEKLFAPMGECVPKAHNMMTDGPLKLVPKWNKPAVLSYSRSDKNNLKKVMINLIEKNTPYSRIRYMF